MFVIGDSTALATGIGLTTWAEAQPQLAQVEVLGFGGCGLTIEGDMRFQDEWVPAAAGCVELFDTKVPQRVRDGRPDIVVIIGSFWEVTDHRLNGDASPVSVLDAGYREVMLQRYTTYNQLLLDAGAPRVVWVLHPKTDYFWDDVSEPGDDPARYTAFYEVQRLVAGRYAGTASTIDLAAWSDAEGLTTDHSARPDGVHWTPQVATEIAENWLGNEIIQAALH